VDIDHDALMRQLSWDPAVHGKPLGVAGITGGVAVLTERSVVLGLRKDFE
jgi:hypothetical protein